MYHIIHIFQFLCPCQTVIIIFNAQFSVSLPNLTVVPALPLVWWRLQEGGVFTEVGAVDRVANLHKSVCGSTAPDCGKVRVRGWRFLLISICFSRLFIYGYSIFLMEHILIPSVLSLNF